MTTVLQSFVAGRWMGQQAAQALHSAINGKEVAFAHAESLDFAEALHYGRNTGLQGICKAFWPWTFSNVLPRFALWPNI
ncbi:MAG: Bifunctional protein PaaZ [Pseudomonadota bacterium]